MRATAARGRNATIETASIFAGVLKCVVCGGPVVRISKGPYKYLVCSSANRKGTKGCTYRTVRYTDVEQALRRNAKAIIREAPRGRDSAELEREIAALDDTVSIISDEAKDLADELIREKSGVLRQRLRDKETALERARENLRELRARRDTLGGPYVDRRLKALGDALRSKTCKPADVNRTLKEAVSKIVMDPGTGRLEIHWQHAKETTGDIPFWSRHSRTFRDARDHA
jgi:hypothetical protein